MHLWEDLDDVDVSGGGNSTSQSRSATGVVAYLLVDRVGMRVVVDNVTTLGSVRFYVSKRVGGTVLNCNAAKWIKSIIE